MIKVSVIVTVYRTQQWLDRCVDSIVKQSYRDLEIVLVDDGSPDECPALCDAWAGRDARVRVLHKKNGGLMAAWMDGVGISSGAYLCFVDSDDWIDSCMIEEMVAAASGSGREIICGNYVQEEKNRSVCVIQPMAPGVYGKEALRGQLFGKLLGQERRPVTLSRCMKLFSRELIEENMRFCDPRIVMGEDVNISLPAILSAERIVLLPEACHYHYLFLRDSMAHRYDPKLMENIDALCRVAEKILREKEAPDWEAQVGQERIWLTFLAMKNEVRGKRPGWRERLAGICKDARVREAVETYPLSIEAMENRILYFTLKHPNRVLFVWLYALFWVYDKRRR